MAEYDPFVRRMQRLADMSEVADAIARGEACARCGEALEPGQECAPCVVALVTGRAAPPAVEVRTDRPADQVASQIAGAAAALAAPARDVVALGERVAARGMAALQQAEAGIMASVAALTPAADPGDLTDEVEGIYLYGACDLCGSALNVTHDGYVCRMCGAEHGLDHRATERAKGAAAARRADEVVRESEQMIRDEVLSDGDLVREPGGDTPRAIGLVIVRDVPEGRADEYRGQLLIRWQDGQESWHMAARLEHLPMRHAVLDLAHRLTFCEVEPGAARAADTTLQALQREALAARRAADEARAQRDALQHHSAALRAELERAQQGQQQADREAATALADKRRAVAERDDAQRVAAELREALEAAERETERIKLNSNAAQSKLDDAYMTAGELRSELETARADLQRARQHIARLEGSEDRAVMAARLADAQSEAFDARARADKAVEAERLAREALEVAQRQTREALAARDRARDGERTARDVVKAERALVRRAGELAALRDAFNVLSADHSGQVMISPDAAAVLATRLDMVRGAVRMNAKIATLELGAFELIRQARNTRSALAGGYDKAETLADMAALALHLLERQIAGALPGEVAAHELFGSCADDVADDDEAALDEVKP